MPYNSLDIDQFSNFFHCQNHKKIGNSTIIPTHLKCVVTLSCEMSVS